MIVVVTVFVQRTGLDRRTGREFFQPPHFGFEGVYALLELSDAGVLLLDDGALLLVDGSVLLEQGQQ